MSTAFLVSCVACWLGFVLGTFADDVVDDRGLRILRWVAGAAVFVAMVAIVWIGDPP